MRHIDETALSLPPSLYLALSVCLFVFFACSFHMLTASGRIRIWKLPMATEAALAPVRLGNKFDLFQITAKKQWTILFILSTSLSFSPSVSLLASLLAAFFG